MKGRWLLILALLVASTGFLSRAPRPALAAPTNDNFADAITITTPVQSGIVATADTTGATTETGEQLNFFACNSQQWTSQATVWYNWTPSSSGTFVLDTYGSTFNTALVVYTGSALGSLTIVACSRDFPTNALGNASAVEVTVTAGTIYRIQAGGVLGTTPTGSLVLSMSLGAEMFVNNTGDVNADDGFLTMREAILLARGGTGAGGLNRALGSGEITSVLNVAAAGEGSSDIVRIIGGLISPISLTSALPPLNANADVVSGLGAGLGVVNGSNFDCFAVSGNANRIEGLQIRGCAGAGSPSAVLITGDDNIIGGTTVPSQRNLIVINSIGVRIDAGASGNKVIGNTIGVPDNGSAVLVNDVGVNVSGDNNTIGGSAPGEGNQITGVISEGTTELVRITGAQAFGNQVVGNLIGTNAAGTAQGNFFTPYSSTYGVRIDSGAHDNTVGGSGAGEGNVISSSGSTGVSIESGPANVVVGNKIGTDITGSTALPNVTGVLVVGAAVTLIGGLDSGEGNAIAFNGNDGVRVEGATATGNTVRGNSIHDNVGLGINNSLGGNTELAPPAIVAAGPVSGTACPNCTVDVYSDSADEGRIYHGSTVADGAGNWSFSGSVAGPNITATATDGSGNTSEFSDPFVLPDTDGDGVFDGADNCPLTSNPGQENTPVGPIDNGPGVAGDDATIPNDDSIGDACDGDADNDGLPDAEDTNPLGATGVCAAFAGASDGHPGPAGGDLTNDDDHDGDPAPAMGFDASDNGPSWDTDNDGALDGYECAQGSDPRDRASKPAGLPDDNTDTDGDGLWNAWERRGWGTDPAVGDSDGDSLGDCKEAADVNGDGIVNFVADTVPYGKASLQPAADFGKTMDFDINKDGMVTFTGDVVPEAKFALITGLCK